MRRRALASLVFPLLPLAVLLIGWQLAAMAWPLRFLFIGSPQRLVLSLPTYYARDAGVLWVDVRVTMLELAVGLAIGSAIGTGAGIAMALSGAVRDTVRPLLLVFNSIPKVALAPLVIVWFGFGITGKVVLVMLIALVIFALNVHAAAEQVEPIWFAHVRALGARGLRPIGLVMLPASLPGVLTSFRLAVGNCFRMVVFAEFIGSSAGLGYALVQYGNALDLRGVLIVVGLLLVISLLLDEGAKRAEARTQKWRAA